MVKKKLEEKIKETVEQTAEQLEIEEKHKAWTEEQAKKVIDGLAYSTGTKAETLTQPLGERGVFETKARVPITQEILIQISEVATIISRELIQAMLERKTANDKVKELEARQAEILEDIQTMTHQVTLDAKWVFDWDNDIKRLIGIHAGKEIIINTVDITSMDRQLKLDDAIQQAKDQQAILDAPAEKKDPIDEVDKEYDDAYAERQKRYADNLPQDEAAE